MHDIICPHCNTAFKIDEAGYSAILKQVRDHQFNHEIADRIKLMEEQQKSAVELAVARVREELQRATIGKDEKIAELKAKLDATATEKTLAVTTALADMEKQRDKLQSDLEKAQLEKQLGEKAIREKFEMQIKDRDDAIERLRDIRAKLSTKMLGETLEQHCAVAFGQIRAAAFPRAKFDKDNDASFGSKGDFIFREADEHGTEFISIMFEMKNEAEQTATKKKNEDFLRELDKDRREKNCEYAVLVSTLEADNELYNSGIYDVSHLYPKMYVVRPQFFIPIITLLRNAALNSLQFKTELAQIREQNIDIATFEDELEKFKDGFSRNYELASRKFKTAIDEIDKTMSHLQKTKDALVSSENNLRLANEKAGDITIKRLTKNNPTMAEKFAAVGKNQDDE